MLKTYYAFSVERVLKSDFLTSFWKAEKKE